MTQRITYPLLTRGEKNKRREVYQEIKRQVRAVHKGSKGSKGNKGEEGKDAVPIVDISEMPSWSARLPNMHQLLLSENFETRRYSQEVFEILGGDDPAPLRSLVNWIDRHFPKTEAYVTDPKQMCKIVSALAANAKLLLLSILHDEEYIKKIAAQSDHVDFLTS